MTDRYFDLCVRDSMLPSSSASPHTCPTPLMTTPSSATSKALSDTGVCCSGVSHLTPHSVWVCYSVCGVWEDPPTALSGGDSCHQFTEGHTSFSLLYRSHDLEGEGHVHWSFPKHAHCNKHCMHKEQQHAPFIQHMYTADYCGMWYCRHVFCSIEYTCSCLCCTSSLPAMCMVCSSLQLTARFYPFLVCFLGKLHVSLNFVCSVYVTCMVKMSQIIHLPVSAVSVPLVWHSWLLVATCAVYTHHSATVLVNDSLGVGYVTCIWNEHAVHSNFPFMTYLVSFAQLTLKVRV